MEQKDIPTLIMTDEAGSDLSTLKITNPKYERHRSSLILERTVQIFLSLGSLLLFCFLVYSLLDDVQIFFRYALKPAAARYWPNAAAVVTILVVGYNLYLFRGYKRLWFGVAELILAGGLGWYAINKAVAGSAYDGIVILLVALYLAGRGFVNVSRRFQPLQIPDDEKP